MLVLSLERWDGLGCEFGVTSKWELQVSLMYAVIASLNTAVCVRVGAVRLILALFRVHPTGRTRTAFHRRACIPYAIRGLAVGIIVCGVCGVCGGSGSVVVDVILL